MWESNSTFESTDCDDTCILQRILFYLLGETQPAVHVHAEETVPWLPLSGRTQTVLHHTRPRCACSARGAAQHLTHFLVVQVHVEIGRHLPAFSHVQQRQRDKERLDLVEDMIGLGELADVNF